MPGTKKRGETIRQFILAHVAYHPHDIAAFTAEHFGISRQAASIHLRRLVTGRALARNGSAKNIRYRLLPNIDETIELPLEGLEEDAVWSKSVRPFLSALPKNVLSIWNYGVTEMVNNAIDHSGGDKISITVRTYLHFTDIAIVDNGIGIFKHLQQRLGLQDEHHAVLELSKGKVTTDPERHTGQGIFFSSRVFDGFCIVSGSVFFTHDPARHEDWIFENDDHEKGTCVWMRLSNDSPKDLKKVFYDYTTNDDVPVFNKTVVPVVLAKYGDENLVSRSQAKRLLARVDAFAVVILDFAGVEEIGQAFADEVFRVFKNQHPDVELTATRVSEDVRKMIDRVSASR